MNRRPRGTRLSAASFLLPRPQLVARFDVSCDDDRFGRSLSSQLNVERENETRRALSHVCATNVDTGVIGELLVQTGPSRLVSAIEVFCGR